MNPTKPDSHAADASHQKAEATTTRNRPASEPGGCVCVDCDQEFIGAEWHMQCGICATRQTAVWLCSCGSPSLPGVLHRADRPCYRVEAHS